MRRSAAVMLVGALLLAGPAFAQWSDNPAANTPVTIPGSNCEYDEIASDGTGGYFVSWNGADGVHVQHFTFGGFPAFGAGGKMLAADTWDSTRVISDGAGGCIVSWYDGSVSDAIFAQRISKSGDTLWTDGGVRVIDGSVTSAYCGPMVSDGAGGAIIMNYYGTVNRVAGNGSLPWGAPVVFDSTTNSQAPKMIPDGSNGAIMTWQDTNSNIVVQRIDVNGNLKWGANGVQLTTSDDARCPRIASDGNGGAFVAWWLTNGWAYPFPIYAQHVNSSGAPQWANPGALVTANAGRHYDIDIARSQTGAIVTFVDNTDWNMHAVRLTGTGSVAWETPLSTTGNFDDAGDRPSTVIPDGSGGAIASWCDNDGANYTVRAQRVSSNGSVLWDADGVVVSIGPDGKYCNRMAGDANGSAIVWLDDRNGSMDIYIQKVSKSGNLSGGDDHMWWCFAGTAPTSGTAALGLLAGALALLGLSRLVRK